MKRLTIFFVWMIAAISVSLQGCQSQQDDAAARVVIPLPFDPMRPQDPFIGRDILNGQFQILQKIGSGGMGAVYKALQPDMNRMVGVKILHPKLANRKDLVSRFRREARAMSQLTHPNTVKVFMYGELDDGSLYIIMEYLEGKNLNQTVRGDGPFPLERGLPVLIAACGAIDGAAAHLGRNANEALLVQALLLQLDGSS